MLGYSYAERIQKIAEITSTAELIEKAKNEIEEIIKIKKETLEANNFLKRVVLRKDIKKEKKEYEKLENLLEKLYDKVRSTKEYINNIPALDINDDGNINGQNAFRQPEVQQGNNRIRNNPNVNRQSGGF